MNVRFFILPLFVLVAGCASPEAEDADTGDQGVSIKDIDNAGAIDSLANLLPEGIYEGSVGFLGEKRCTVDISVTRGKRFVISMYLDEDVRADGTVDGPYYKFELGTGPRYVLRKFDWNLETVYAVAEVKPNTDLDAEKSKLWASTLDDARTSYVRIRQKEGLLGLLGEEMVCNGLVRR